MSTKTINIARIVSALKYKNVIDIAVKKNKVIYMRGELLK